MAWIKTVPPSEADDRLKELMTKQRELYPAEYMTPVEGTDEAGRVDMPNIVSSHSLIPDALFHAFSTFGALMSPDLPLTRRQQEMITTTVSVTNKCFY